MPTVLLTTVCRPFGGKGEGDSVGSELFHAQVTRSQGIFSYRQVIRCWGLDYIAENIDAPTVVLHYPSERELLREITTRHYDYIGINFVVATFHKLRRMTELIRKHSPHSQIVAGGYGTALPEENLRPFCDQICQEEGISFMRRLLGENARRPIRHPYAPIESPRVYSHARASKVAHITSGLGCPNGCDFCSTSHFYKRKYIPFMKSGRELYETILRMEEEARRVGDELSGFIIIDEDFFLQAKRAREFHQCVRDGGKPLSIMGFGSVRGLSRFTADEIAEMGFDLLWTAVEGKESGYGKLEGRDHRELYEALKSRGVALLTSMIIGFPYQDRQRVLEEARQLRALGPSLWQILIYFALPGTPFHRQVLDEGRYLAGYRENPDYRKFDGFAMHHTHPHFTAGQLEELQRDLYRENFELLGPSMIRVLKTWFDGYLNLENSLNPLLRARAERMRDCVRSAVAGLYPAILFGPNQKRREEARAFLKAIEQKTGRLTSKERFLCLASVPFAVWTWLAAQFNCFQQPKLLRVAHRLETLS